MTFDAGPPGARRWRWYGEPGEEPPDAGDVLCYVDRVGDEPDWFHEVHHATQVSGKGPEHVWLVVTRHDAVDGAIPQVVTDALEQPGRRLIDAVVRKPRRRRR